MALSVASSRPSPLAGTELVRNWEPPGPARAVFVLLHGIAEHSGRYEHVGSLLSEAGFRVRAFDLLGHGMTGGRRCDVESWERFYDQVESHVVECREETGLPVVLLGHSLGGTLALGYAASPRPSPDLMVVSAPALTGGAQWQRFLARTFGSVLPTLRAPQKVSGAHLSRDPSVGERYFADPLVVTSGTFRMGKEFFDAMDRVSDQVHALRQPVLVLHGGDDRLVPTASSEPLAQLQGFERRVYPGLRHEIFNEPEGPEIVAEVGDWVGDRI
jgi:alpha-beta hydrolase superfamily lysophospholipase